MCRRNSESYSNDVNRSHTSLHKIQSRRQLSAASEPDSLELRESLTIINLTLSSNRLPLPPRFQLLR